MSLSGLGFPLPLPPLQSSRCPFLVILSTRSSPVHNFQSFPHGSMLGVYGIGWSEKRIGETTYTDDPFLVGRFNRLEMLPQLFGHKVSARLRCRCNESAPKANPASGVLRLTLASSRGRATHLHFKQLRDQPFLRAFHTSRLSVEKNAAIPHITKLARELTGEKPPNHATFS
jgi:hypothetical protein